LQLVEAMYEHRVSVGVLLTDATADQEQLLIRTASRLDLDLQVRRASPGANGLRELAYLSGTTVLLAVPDSTIYTAESLPGILESTYRRGQPVIGFSPALVAAGTLAAAYASLDDVLAHLDQVIAEVETGRIPSPQYPMYWRVAVNDNVARSLNVVLSKNLRALGNSPLGRQK
jgi:putative ABC transport system substrate-binding protein